MTSGATTRSNINNQRDMLWWSSTQVSGHDRVFGHPQGERGDEAV